jgi:tRNA pseudouridine55 synthase
MIDDGAILVNKHQGITSFDVISSLRRILRIRQIGHCGTLDPLARGLVIVCFGRATKLVQFLSHEDKRYEADIKLGRTTSTYDRYGVVTGESAVDAISEEEVERALESFTGDIRQTVPPHSAAKYQGRPRYEYARNGINIPAKKREVTIHKIRLIEFVSPHVRIDVTCSKGTYIRSIAHELGRKLGCGAHLFSLSRLRVGRYSLEDALTLNQIAARKNLNRLSERIIDLPGLLDFPFLTVSEAKRLGIANGAGIFARDIERVSGGFGRGQKVSLTDSAGQLLAVCEALLASSELEANKSVSTPVFKYIRVI